MTDLSEIKTSLVMEWVKPSDLHKVWKLIKPGLEKIHERSTGWDIEDVYVAIKTTHSVLHLGYLDGKYAGFIVTSNEVAPRGTIINIWCLYCEANDFSIFEQHIETVKDWAKNIGAYAIRMQTPRKGWERQAPKLGFRPIHQVFELEVGD